MTEPIAPNPEPTAPAVAPAPAAPASNSIAESTLRDGYAAEVAAGRLTQADADRMLAEDMNLAPGESAALPGDSEAVAYLKSQGIQPAEARDFKLPPLAETEHTPLEDVVAADTQIRQWLTAGAFEKGVGDAIADAAVEAHKVWATLDEASRELHNRSTEADLRRLYGDAYDAKLAGARQLVAELEKKSPGVVRVLQESGAGSSRVVIGLLMRHAEVLGMRHQAAA